MRLTTEAIYAQKVQCLSAKGDALNNVASYELATEALQWHKVSLRLELAILGENCNHSDLRTRDMRPRNWGPQAIRYFTSHNPFKLWPTAPKMTIQIRCSGNVIQNLPLVLKQTCRLNFKPLGEIKTTRIMGHQYAANPKQTHDFLACQNLFENVHHPHRLESRSKVQITFIALCFCTLPLRKATCNSSRKILCTTLPHNDRHVCHIIDTSCRALQIVHYNIKRSLETLTQSQALGGNILIRSKVNEVDVRYIKGCTFEER